MGRNLFTHFDTTEEIQSSQLAIEHTVLDNEQTLLSYLWSGAALVIIGISILGISNKGWFADTGFVCIPSGLVTILFGILRFRKMFKAISAVSSELKSISKVNNDLSEKTGGII